ncbi:MAG: UDP-N-acetylmuramoyl-tripeptide--D-alanyl-D-alanine ligase [Candidatus Sungbacteria bacterium]|nr:UDP-N-acetylmuramoyl-tripeptide--D-alanyl-D-alanine ligase [bacterium]MDZ4285467.1 UDP-N-acetylmuramoyl-tripeptide--D-alanyl-D-alanine ligase [Candidatus Sungbacteria bacterium]
MIKKWLSHYHPRYVRSLIYMLQQSEYDVRDYLRWYRRVEDFSHVERRKQLVKTLKALLLLFVGWLMVASMIATGIVFLLNDRTVLRFIIFVIWIIAVPYLLAYIIPVFVFLIKLGQKPIEYILIFRAKKKLRGHKGFKIAIAGSFGKTSMREILKTVLAEEKKVAAPPQSYNTPLSICKFIDGLQGDEEILIFELGEYYPGDVRKLCNLIQPDIGVITGVNEAHLQKFKNLERTARTIFELSDFLGEKPVFINGENEKARMYTLPRHIIYTRKGAGNIKVMHPYTDLAGIIFTLDIHGHEMNMRSSLLGLHQVGPLVAAANIAYRLGVSFDAIQKGLNKTKPFDHRLEPKTDAHGVITLDDSYNGNPDGVKAVIEFLASFKGHRRIYVTPGLVEMGSRMQEVHREIGRELASAGIERIILIKNSVTPYIDQGLKESGYAGEIVWFDDGLSALAALPHLTVSGDIVLLQNDWPDQYA